MSGLIKKEKKGLIMYKFTLLFVVLFITGCSFRPDMPEANIEFTYEKTSEQQIKQDWWKDFGDEKLSELIQTALQNNNDLLIALNNMDIAAVNLGLARREYLPNISLQGSASRTRTSGELPNYPDNMEIDNFSASAVLSYEVDLWGRVRNTARANKALFKASIYDYENARLSIASSVAETYFTLGALNEQEEILKDTLETYENTLNFRQKELENGAITQLVYFQTKASVDSAKSQLFTLQDSITKTKTALHILVGKSINDILNLDLNVTNEQVQVPQVPNGIHSDILLHRADIASALEKLKASNALVGVARANYFPRLSLTGAYGFASDELSRLFIQNANTWNIGGSLVMPLLDFGRTSKNVDLAKLSQNISFLNYDKTLKNAFGEIKNALNLRQNSFLRLESAKDLLESQQKVFDLSKVRYEQGYSSHLDFLDAQRLLLSAKLNLAQAKLNSLTSALSVYKSLGGGFNQDIAQENADNR